MTRQIVMSPNWKPSPGRSIPVAIPVNIRTRALLADIPQLSWAPKTSADNLDYVVDPTDWLAEVGDILVSVEGKVLTATGIPTDLAVSWASVISGMAVVFLGGGPPGTIQTVNVTMTSSSGRIVTTSVQIAISTATDAAEPQTVPALSSGTPVPPNAMQLGGNRILVVASGAPYIIA